MTKLRWLKFGIVFSIIIFLAIYFFIYMKITSSNGIIILKLGNMDISFLKVFFSSIKNVVLSSLVLGFLIGAIPPIGARKKEN
jgi:hypothetical protein